MSLSPSTMSTVQATAPAVRERGVEISRRMYERLFQKEAMKNLFDQSRHGEGGSQSQAFAGAANAYAYADTMDRLTDLGPMIERIAQKHVALNIRPEHYPLVGEALLGAIRDVLGAAATEEVLAAWAEAYAFLADVLMERESELYQETGAALVGRRDFVVDRIDPEREVITSV
jgi:nitric oxide dioxygenase